jgi:hypothetical protein
MNISESISQTDLKRQLILYHRSPCFYACESVGIVFNAMQQSLIRGLNGCRQQYQLQSTQMERLRFCLGESLILLQDEGLYLNGLNIPVSEGITVSRVYLKYSMERGKISSP